MATSAWTNWGGTVRGLPRAVHRPASEAEVARLLAEATAGRRRVKIVGSGHSCSAIACPDGVDAIRLDRMAGVLGVDRARRRVRIQGGIRLAALSQALASHGLALPMLPSIAAPTFAGAAATGTHGTGMHAASLAERITAMRVVTADGSVLTVGEDTPDRLDAFRTSLGALGVVTELALSCDDAFDVRCRDEPATLDEALRDIERRSDEQEEQASSIHWFPHTDRALLRTFVRVPPAPRSRAAAAIRAVRGAVVGNRLHEALLLLHARGLASAASVNRCFFDAAFARPTAFVAPSHEALVATILVRQRVLEYAVPLERARAACEALRRAIRDEGHEAQSPIEVRFGGAERAWLGLAHGRPTCWIGVIAYRPFGQETPWERFFRRADAVLRAEGGRPHWAKIHWQDAASLRPLYPRFDDFVALRAEVDRHGTFLDGYLRRVLGVA